VFLVSICACGAPRLPFADSDRIFISEGLAEHALYIINVAGRPATMHGAYSVSLQPVKLGQFVSCIISDTFSQHDECNRSLRPR
jgi:hypothetical protein